ncbi:MAG: hypothetical protein JNM93_08755 [Bacteriovoracaceae bacterium]|nr:hypothetical protein [Bacteriovoracaceae bacterium]
MKCLLVFLMFFLVGCGVEKTPELMEETNENMKASNALLNEFDDKVGQFLESCYIYLFKHDIISPYDTQKKNTIYLTQKVFDEKIMQEREWVMEVPVKELEIHYLKDDQAYYVIPSQYRKLIPQSSVKKIAKEDSLCFSVEEMIDTKIESTKESVVDYIEDNDDIFLQKIADILSEIEERKIDCKKYELERAKQAYLDSQIKWYHFKKKKEFKLRQKFAELEKSLAPHPCQQSQTFEALSDEKIAELENKHDQDWSTFKTSWEAYYQAWQVDKRLVFNLEVREQIKVPAFTNTRVKALYQLRKEEFANKFKLLDLAEAFLPVENPVKLKKFLTNNEKGMRIDPAVSVDYSEVELARIELLGTIFKRYYYSGNTKAEKELIRYFIVDSVFLLFEQQLEVEQISQSRLK